MVCYHFDKVGGHWYSNSKDMFLACHHGRAVIKVSGDYNDRVTPR